MADINNPEVFDKRLVERHIREEKVSQADFQNYLTGLHDSAENAEKISFDDDKNAEGEEGAIEETHAAPADVGMSMNTNGAVITRETVSEPITGGNSGGNPMGF